MPINLKPDSNFWSRIFGDTASPGSGTQLAPARFDHFNSDIGNRATVATEDGDLTTIDTAAERLSLNPIANTGGNANVPYTWVFMLRWLLGLIQDVLSRLPAALGSTANSSSFSVSHASATHVETQLTATGATTSRSTSGYRNLVAQYKVAAIGTSVVVRLEGSNDNTNWFNLDTADTTQTANGTYAFALNVLPAFVRFNLVTITGGSPTVDTILRFS